MIRTKLSTLALASVLALPLATTACSPGQSPTEPGLSEPETSSASASSVVSVTDESRRGRGKGGNGRNDDRNDDRQQRPRAPRGGQEFEGAVSSVNGSSLTLASGVRVVVNGSTQWSGRGDLFSLSQVAGSLAAGLNPRVEGRGTRQADGSILALTIKGEDEEDD